MRALLAVAIGILVAFFVGSVIGTQMVKISVVNISLKINWGMRWSSSWRDIVGLSANASIFAICGALCIGLLHPLLNFAFGVDVFAPARSLVGLAGQGLAGALGGMALSRVLGASRTLQ